MHGLVDNALMFYVVLGLAVLGLAYGWWANRRREWLIALTVVLGLLALLFVLARLIVTDQMQLRTILNEMGDGVTNKRPEQVVKHLSKKFTFEASNQTLSKESTRQAIVNSVRAYHIQEVYIWNFEVEKLSRAEGTAHVKFNVRVTAGFDASAMPFLCRSEFVLEDGQWRMKTFQIFNPVANTDKPIRFPVP